MLALILVVIFHVKAELINKTFNNDFRNNSELFFFVNVLQRLSIRFTLVNNTEDFFLFHGIKCTSYLYKKQSDFELKIANGYNHEIYNSPLDDKLYFETNPFKINGKLMNLTQKQGSLQCVGYKYLAFLAEVSELTISDTLEKKIVNVSELAISHILEKDLICKNNHIDLLALLIAIPLCVIILLSNRDLLAKYLGIKRYIPTRQETIV